MSDKNEIKIIKKRFKCTKCKIIESHSLNSAKRTCSKCGSILLEISEKEYLLIKNKRKKDLEENEKEKNNNVGKTLIKGKNKKKSLKEEKEKSDDEQKEKMKKKVKKKFIIM
jgi:predicted  nucleic acid-binding Zn-ribbon protein